MTSKLKPSWTAEVKYPPRLIEISKDTGYNKISTSIILPLSMSNVSERQLNHLSENIIAALQAIEDREYDW